MVYNLFASAAEARVPELVEPVMVPEPDELELDEQKLADFFLGGFFSVPVRSLTLYSSVL